LRKSSATEAEHRAVEAPWSPDPRPTEQQKQAVLDAFTGKLGGPLADLAGLAGEVLAIESVPITHETVEGTGTLRVPGIIDAEMAPYRAKTLVRRIDPWLEP
jgi:hypothetical protein